MLANPTTLIKDTSDVSRLGTVKGVVSQLDIPLTWYRYRASEATRRNFIRTYTSCPFPSGTNKQRYGVPCKSDNIS